MANREALRELQTRLASRLQAARTEGVSIAWLAVKAGESNYLFPLALSGEIFPLPTVQVVPYSRPWFLGVVNLRGGVYGVVDLASFVGDGQTRVRSEQALSESSLVTFNTALEVNCALMVDGLSGLRNRESFSSSEPAPEGSPVYFGNRYRDLGGADWQEINLRSLSQFASFLSISV
jgi:twitching motility protein PilI